MSFELNIDKYLNCPAWSVETGKGVRVSRRWDRRVLSGMPSPVVEMDSVFNGHLTADEAMERAKAVSDAAFIAKQIECMAFEIEARWDFQEKKRQMRAERSHVEEKPRPKIPTLSEEQATQLVTKLQRMLKPRFKYGRHERWGENAERGERHVDTAVIQVEGKRYAYDLSMKGNGLYIHNYGYNRNRAATADLIHALTGKTRRQIKITITGYEAVAPYEVESRWDKGQTKVMYTERFINEPLKGAI